MPRTGRINAGIFVPIMEQGVHGTPLQQRKDHAAVKIPERGREEVTEGIWALCTVIATKHPEPELVRQT